MPRYGIDTSILVRLLTGDPESDFEKVRGALEGILTADPAAEIEVSNIVIGEAYFVLQHHYGISKEDAREALVSVLTSGLVKPMHGAEIIALLNQPDEPGLMDRLIAEDYSAQRAITLTRDRKMARLGQCKLLG